VLGGSFGRLDAVGNARAVSDKTNLSATLTHAESDNYKDGAGHEVHSAYERQSATVLGGYKIDSNTRIDVDATVSRGEAAYADRSVDGSLFDRQSYGVSLEKKNVSERVKKVSARVYHSYIDHVMDNYSLREDPAAGSFSAMNPDRTTDGMRFSADLSLGLNDLVILGADWRQDSHTSRNTMMGANSAAADLYSTLPRKVDYKSRFAGIFGEWTHTLGIGRKVVSGLRVDNWAADRWFVTMMNAQTYQGEASETLKTGFIRFEQELSPQARGYIGFGVNERPMDYWEGNRFEGITTTTTNVLKPESTRQLDVGAIWRTDRTQGALSIFYGKVSDYILIYSGTPSAASNSACQSDSGFLNVRYHSMAGGSCVASGNVNATRLGFEGDIRHRLGGGWNVWGSVAYVYAENDTMNVPLAQTPPLEVKLGSDYTAGNWTMGGVLRAVARQSRIHYNYGNIVGLDRASATPGFATLGINANFKPNKSSQVSFGIDNLFDRNYHEHISRTDSSVAGYTVDPTTAVNEPGRTFWVKAQANF
jgi:iron complex outermembrane receptor protein